MRRMGKSHNYGINPFLYTANNLPVAEDEKTAGSLLEEWRQLKGHFPKRQMYLRSVLLPSWTSSQSPSDHSY